MNTDIMSHLDIEILGLLSTGDYTRNEMVVVLGRARTTLYDHLQRLIDMGLVQKKTSKRTTRGRPKVYFTLTEAYDRRPIPLQGVEHKITGASGKENRTPFRIYWIIGGIDK